MFQLPRSYSKTNKVICRLRQYCVYYVIFFNFVAKCIECMPGSYLVWGGLVVVSRVSPSIARETKLVRNTPTYLTHNMIKEKERVRDKNQGFVSYCIVTRHVTQ